MWVVENKNNKNWNIRGKTPLTVGKTYEFEL